MVVCSACGRENPSDSRFCNSCGAPLGARRSEGDGMAAGDVVNTAARLQSAAPVNGVLVGESTYRATRHVIDYEEAEPVVAKGKSEPLAVWEAVEPRSRATIEAVSSAP